MPPGLDCLQHIVVVMMENRSFDHLLGYLKAQDAQIDGVTGTETNPDTTGALAPVRPKAQYQSQLDPDPGHSFEDVNTQIFGDPPGPASMQGFVKSYFNKLHDVNHSRQIMYCFDPSKVTVITTLARKFAVFTRWFSSIPGPTIPNRAFAHFGTSFGKVDNSIFYLGAKYKTIYERMNSAGHSAKIYYCDATIAMTFLLKDQPQLFGSFDDFKADCASGNLPEYCFVEPNYADDPTPGGTRPASDQHPDHNVLAGEEYLAAVYNAIRKSQQLWLSTLLLIVYDEHGGVFDHVVPPACTPDGFQDATTGFKFDRLGVRVPAVLVSPWIPEATVISDQAFEHACIPATVTKKFIGEFEDRSPREKNAATFLDYLTLATPRTDQFFFQTGGGFFLLPEAPTGGANMIPIPSIPAMAMQPQRPASSLLLDHVAHLREIENKLPPDQRTGIVVGRNATEAEAGNYIRQMTAKLRAGAAKAAKK